MQSADQQIVKKAIGITKKFDLGITTRIAAMQFQNCLCYWRADDKVVLAEGRAHKSTRISKTLIYRYCIRKTIIIINIGGLTDVMKIKK